MFAESIRRAVAAAPRHGLQDVSSLLWKAFAAGQVTESEASEISGLIEARKAVHVPPAVTAARAGSRPRTEGSMGRRRRLATQGWLPNTLCARFTVAEMAVLAVIAREFQAKGRCSLPIGLVSAFAGVGRTTVKNAIREARRQGLLHVEQRRRAGKRSDTNVVTVVSAEWVSWLCLARKGGGVKSVTTTYTDRYITCGGRSSGKEKGLPEGRMSAGWRETKTRAGRVKVGQ